MFGTNTGYGSRAGVVDEGRGEMEGKITSSMLRVNTRITR